MKPTCLLRLLTLATVALFLVPERGRAQAPVITAQPLSQMAIQGAEVGLQITASGTPPQAFSWFFESALVSGATNALLVLTNVQSSQSGGYRVVVANASGSVTSVIANLTVVTGAVREVWRTRYDGPANGPDELRSMTVDPTGAVYVAGTSFLTNNGTEIVTIKYDPQGAPLWVRRFRGPDRLRDEGRAIAVSVTGHVLVTGISEDAQRGADFITLKYDANGALLWAARYDGMPHAGDKPVAVAVSDMGEVAVVGNSFCPGSGDDLVTVKYDANGMEIWNNRYDGPAKGHEEARSVAFDRDGNVIAAGSSPGTSGERDYAVIKYGPAGTVAWVRRYDGPGQGEDDLTALAVDAAGHVYVTGASEDHLHYEKKFATLKYDSAGNLLWLARHHETDYGNDVANALLVDDDGNVYVTGRTYDYASDHDFLTVKYDPAGSELWAARYGSFGFDVAQALAQDAAGNVYVTGNSFDPATLNDFATLKYDPQGNRLWAVRFNGLSASPEWVTGLGVDSAGNVYVGGTSSDAGAGPDLRAVKYQQIALAGAPRFTLTPSSLTVIEGTNLTLMFAATGDPPLGFQWFRNSVPYSGDFNAVILTSATNTSLVFANIAGYQAGYYHVVVTNGVAKIVSPQTRVEVLMAPSIYSQPKPQAVFAGTVATFGVLHYGTPPVSYQWLLNEVAIPGATNSSLVISNAKPSDLGNYRVILTNVVGQATSSNAALTIITGPVGQIWQARFDSGVNNPDVVEAMVLDSAGNVYVTGSSYDTNYIIGFLTVKYDPDGHELWRARLVAAEARAIAVDTAGNVYVTGNTFSYSDDYDIATAKYDANGNPLWVVRYDGPGSLHDIGRGIAVDASGNVYVAGESHAGAVSGVDLITIKFGADGNELWVRRYNGPGSGDEVFGGMALDSTSHVHVTAGSPGAGTGLDFITIRYDANGNTNWIARFNASGNLNDTSRAITLDAGGNVLVAGNSRDGATLNDYLTVKYDANGEELWVRRYNGPDNGDEAVSGLTVDAAGNVYVTGASPGPATGLDYATVKYDSLGGQVWVARFDGAHSPDDVPRAVVVDQNQNVYVTGASFHPDQEFNFVTIKYSETGSPLWVIPFNGPVDSADLPQALAVDSAGQVHVAGASRGQGTDFDYMTIKYGQTNFAANARPQVALLAPRNPSTLIGPAHVTLQAEASDPDGNVVRVEFYQGSTLIGVAAESPYTVTWSNVTAGSYVVMARAVDDDGAAGYSGAARINVLLPVVVVPQPGTNVLADIESSVSFSVTASGTDLAYQWRLNGVNIPDATDSIYTINTVHPNHGGSYSVVVANPVSARTIDIAQLIPNVLTLALSDAFAARPVHDGFSEVFRASNTNATRETGETNHAGKAGGKSVWFGWRPPASGIATLSTGGSGFDTLLAVYTNDLSLNPQPSTLNLVLVASDDDRGEFLTSQVVFDALAGTEYVVAIDGFGGASGNIVFGWGLDTATSDLPQILFQPLSQTVTNGATVSFSVTVVSQTSESYQWLYNCAPIALATNRTLTVGNAHAAVVGNYTVVVGNRPNRTVESLPAFLEIGPSKDAISQDKLGDLLVSAQSSMSLQSASARRWPHDVPVVSAGTLGTQILNNFGATTEAGEANHAGVIGGASRWFILHAQTSGTMQVDTIGSDIDTVLAVYTGTNLLNLTLIASDNNGAPDGIRSLVRFVAAAGADYLIAVDGVNGAQGTIQLNWALPGLRLNVSSGGGPAFTNGSFRLVFDGVAGQSVVLEASTNLLQWLPIVTNAALSGPVEFLDTNAPNHRRRFYRVLVGP